MRHIDVIKKVIDRDYPGRTLDKLFQNRVSVFAKIAMGINDDLDGS